MARRIQSRAVRGPFRGPTRDTFWFSSSQTAEIAVAANVAVLATLATSTNLADLHVVNGTIVRTRGVVLWFSDQSAAQETPTAAVGIRLQNQRAATAGVASVPRPFSEPDLDWFVWQALLGFSVNTVNAIGQGLQRSTIDSKAMRKVKDGHSLIEVIENVSAADGAFFVSTYMFLVKGG